MLTSQLRRIPGLVTTYHILRQWMSLATRQRVISRYLRSHPVTKLQIGSGGNLLAGWLNTDLYGRESVFVDARTKLPFHDQTFDYVFSEHCIEHLEFRDGVRLIQECYRVLKRGGKLRISTPDLRFLIELYSENKTATQQRYIIWALKTEFPDTGLDLTEVDLGGFVISNFFRAWGHMFIYDCKLLSNVFAGCGFIDIGHFQPGESDDENLRGIELHGKHITDEFNALESLVLQGLRPP